jgi:hypothetical protein
MKTLKQRLDELRNETVEKILNGEYYINSLRIDRVDHYELTLIVDGCKFEISIPKNLGYIVYHYYDFNLENGKESNIAKLVYKTHIEPKQKEFIEKRIQELQKQLE